ncbi:MAG TPA: LLM class flavin-dependent oxidoreductase [Stellaceae bacterium]|jgi:alkanesulfonate monooxygenase SsuD/methylene tetrahydromethanopterin reductase-like flavin-dependent oxidoreductase (luciferase family)
MKFAHFAHVWGKKGMTPAARYEQLWRELQLCDELGFDYGFCVEHHFRPEESWMSAPSLFTVAAGARTKHIRLGGMGYIVPLHHPLRLVEEIALADQMTGGRVELGLVPGITERYFEPFEVDFASRREVTLEFVSFLRAAFTDAPSFSFEGKHHHAHDAKLAVNPLQKPHPPLWIETRDAATLEFCAREGINVGYFLLSPREDSGPKYRKFLEDWRKAGHKAKPNLAYSTVVYVDETDQKALDKALAEAGQAYRGFLPNTEDPAELKRHQQEHAQRYIDRREFGAAEIALHLLDADWLLAHDLILIGSPDTVAKKLKKIATEGVFNTFFGEFNFGQLGEADLMRSIRLFGAEVMPQLRDFEPF